jgi:FKBP-type peptidyl-prolyl cis-trans isomerase (trigger factor)
MAEKQKSGQKQNQALHLEDFLLEDPSFEFGLAWEKVEPVYQKTVAQAAKRVKQPGFRPGKVPAKVAEDLLDKGYLIREVLKQLAAEAYKEALAKQKVKPFSEPEVVVIKADKGSEWRLRANLPQKPVIKLPDYKKLLKKYKMKARASLESKVEAGKKEANEKKDLSFKQPTVAQLNLQATDQALLALLQELKPKVSLILVRRSAQREFERLQEQLQKHQLTLNDYLKNTRQTTEMIEERLMMSALQNIQLEFVLDALLEAEKIVANEAEIIEKMKVNFKEMDEAGLKDQLKEPSVKDYFELLAKREKLSKWLTSL